jgi:tRNA threonylcarbamoyladenosine biosynthesis protein TsaB
MLVLAFDTATPVGSVALVDEERIVVSSYFDIGLQHSQRLFVEIDKALTAADLTLADVDAVALTRGPGSFTGLRIGMSAAKGLCLAAGLALVTVSTLEVLAARLLYARHPVCAMLDARKGQVYTALYDTRSGYPEPLQAPRAVDPTVVLAEFGDTKTIFTGDGADAYDELIEGCEKAVRAPFSCARPEAGSVGWLALRRFDRGEVENIATVEPEYLRGPDARVGKGPFARSASTS